MNKNLQKLNQVSICDNKKNCIHITGKNADMITGVVGLLLLFAGISALIKS
jgi:hypothetical protein